MPSSIITLTSDFGLTDGYVAAMKAAILSLGRDVTFVDISHTMPAHDISHAAFVVGTTCRYFPPGTIHLIVVDPGVGTQRAPLILQTPESIYLAPDNGVLTHVLMDYMFVSRNGLVEATKENKFMQSVRLPVPSSCAAYNIDKDEFWRDSISKTFHGRDIFAPVVAHLANGACPEDLGSLVEDVNYLNIPFPTWIDKSIYGKIIYIDHFGNLVSNIRSSNLIEKSVRVEIADKSILGLSSSYADSENCLAIIGSHGYLEIAIKERSAANILKAQIGTEVTVHSNSTN